MSKISNVFPHSYDKNFQKEKSYRKKSCIIFLLLLISLCIVSITSLSSSYVVKVFTNFVFAQEYDQTNLPKFQLSEDMNNYENNSTNSLSDSNKDSNSEKGSSGIFDSGIINGDHSSYKFTFDTQGEYNYYCTLHPWMTAKVIVN